MLSVSSEDVMEAAARIAPWVIETPLIHSPFFSELIEGGVWLKLENIQNSGSFKLRGAANKMLSMDQQQLENGVVTASSGNHAAACAWMARRLEIPLTVYVPDTIQAGKLKQLRRWEVDVRRAGHDCAVTESRAREEALKLGKVFISPYNDSDVITGQATVGLELSRQSEEIDTVLAPVGGGGLISGIALYMKQLYASLEIIGCQPENSPVMAESVWAGRLLDLDSRPTLSDGTAGGLEEDTCTLPVCRELVSDFILLSEEEIARAILALLEEERVLAEGAAALPAAALMKHPERFSGRRVVLIISGSRISATTLLEVLQGKYFGEGRG